MTMTRKNLLTLSSVLVFLLACLCSSMAQKKPVRGLFWKASSPTNTIYLLGSVHLGTKDMYPLPDYIEKAYQRSSVLIVEVDLNKVDKIGQEKVGKFVAAKGTYTGDDTLWKHVNSKTKARVQAFAAQNGLPPEAFAKVKPWLVALTISILPLQKAGMEAGLGIDKYFLGKAKGTKRIEELETMDQQFRLLSEIPNNLEEKYLNDSLDGAGKYKEIGATMVNAWVDGDANKMDAFLSGSFGQTPAISRKLREDRNPHMAEVAESYLKRHEPCFIVVGSAHLVGKEGVIRLLEQKGYKVEQVISEQALLEKESGHTALTGMIGKSQRPGVPSAGFKLTST